MRRSKEQPQQPVVWSKRKQDGRGGVIRFQANTIVRDLLDVASQHGLSLNDIACNGYTRQDREQLAQLIGYSVSGFGDLPYARRAIVADADAKAERLMALRKRRGPTRRDTGTGGALADLQVPLEHSPRAVTRLPKAFPPCVPGR